MNESKVNYSFAIVPNFYEERCKELEEEIAELRAIEGGDENSKIAQYINQLKEKDNVTFWKALKRSHRRIWNIFFHRTLT